MKIVAYPSFILPMWIPLCTKDSFCPREREREGDRARSHGEGGDGMWPSGARPPERHRRSAVRWGVATGNASRWGVARWGPCLSELRPPGAQPPGLGAQPLERGSLRCHPPRRGLLGRWGSIELGYRPRKKMATRVPPDGHNRREGTAAARTPPYLGAKALRVSGCCRISQLAARARARVATTCRRPRGRRCATEEKRFP
jgi:hypothetical protein